MNSEMAREWQEAVSVELPDLDFAYWSVFFCRLPVFVALGVRVRVEKFFERENREYKDLRKM
jgi:hypothetical protein